MKISKISIGLPLRDRVVGLVDSLPPDTVLTTAEVLSKLNLSTINGKTSKILSGLNRRKVVIDGNSQWVYGTVKGIQNLEQQLKGSNENL